MVIELNNMLEERNPSCPNLQPKAVTCSLNQHHQLDWTELLPNCSVQYRSMRTVALSQAKSFSSEEENGFKVQHGGTMV